MLHCGLQIRFGALPQRQPPNFLCTSSRKNLADRQRLTGVLEVIAEEVEVAFVDLLDQVHRQVVEMVLNRMRPLGAVTFAFIETRDRG